MRDIGETWNEEHFALCSLELAQTNLDSSIHQRDCCRLAQGERWGTEWSRGIWWRKDAVRDKWPHRRLNTVMLQTNLCLSENENCGHHDTHVVLCNFILVVVPHGEFLIHAASLVTSFRDFVTFCQPRRVVAKWKLHWHYLTMWNVDFRGKGHFCSTAYHIWVASKTDPSCDTVNHQLQTQYHLAPKRHGVSFRSIEVWRGLHLATAVAQMIACCMNIWWEFCIILALWWPLATFCDFFFYKRGSCAS